MYTVALILLIIAGIFVLFLYFREGHKKKNNLHPAHFKETSPRLGVQNAPTQGEAKASSDINTSLHHPEIEETSRTTEEYALHNEELHKRPNSESLVQEVVASFSHRPNVILRYLCFDNGQDLIDVCHRVSGVMARKGESFVKPIATDFRVEAAGYEPRHKETQVQVALDVLEKILIGKSEKYKTVSLFVNDWEQKVLSKIQERFRGRCPMLGWKWSYRDGIVDTFEFEMQDNEPMLEEYVKTRKIFWKFQDLRGTGDTITCSGDCLHAAVVRSQGDPRKGFGTDYAVVDGVPHPPCDRIAPASYGPRVQFSFDGSVWGYSAVRNGREFVVLNGKESIHYEQLVHPYWGIQAYFGYDLYLSEEGCHVAYGGRKDNKAFMVIHGDEKQLYDNVDRFVWSQDGKHYAYSAEIQKSQCIVIDGKQGPFFENVHSPVFNLEGNHVFYEAKLKNGACVLLDHEAVTDGYDRIQAVQFTHKGTGIAFWGIKGQTAFLIIDGKRVIKIEAENIDAHFQEWQILFSSDGSHFAAVGIKGIGKNIVYKDELEIGCYASVQNLNFDAKGRLLFLAAAKFNNEWFLVIDGERQNEVYRSAQSLLTAPEGNRYAFRAYEKDCQFTVIDGLPSKLKFDDEKDFEHLKFSPNGSYFSYVASRNELFYLVVDDKEIGPYNKIIETHFAKDDLLRFVSIRSDAVELVEWQLPKRPN